MHHRAPGQPRSKEGKEGARELAIANDHRTLREGRADSNVGAAATDEVETFDGGAS